MNEANQLICNICAKSFDCHSKLDSHRKTHSGKRPFTCSLCSKTFASKGNRNAHMRVHTLERPYKCNFCEKKFCQHGQLVIHIRRHTGEKPYICSHCSKRFTCSKVLKNHIRTHTGEKPFKCEYCEKSFAAYGNLVVHKRKHTKERPYICDLCGKSFEHSGNLNRHVRAHNIEGGLKCILCGQVFITKENLWDHISKQHSPGKESSDEIEKVGTVQLEVTDSDLVSPEKLYLSADDSYLSADDSSHKNIDTTQYHESHDAAENKVANICEDDSTCYNLDISVTKHSFIAANSEATVIPHTKYIQYFKETNLKNRSRLTSKKMEVDDDLSSKDIFIQQPPHLIADLPDCYNAPSCSSYAVPICRSDSNTKLPSTYKLAEDAKEPPVGLSNAVNTLSLGSTASDNDQESPPGECHRRSYKCKRLMDLLNAENSACPIDLSKSVRSPSHGCNKLPGPPPLVQTPGDCEKHQSLSNSPGIKGGSTLPPLIPIEHSSHMCRNEYSSGPQSNMSSQSANGHSHMSIKPMIVCYPDAMCSSDCVNYKTTRKPVTGSCDVKTSCSISPDDIKKSVQRKFSSLLANERRFCNFKEKVETAILYLVDEHVLRQFGYPIRNIEQVLITILDQAGMNPCANVRVDELERLKLNMQKFLEYSFPLSSQWDNAGWTGKSMDYVINNIVELVNRQNSQVK